jgi:hypothetical protein
VFSSWCDGWALAYAFLSRHVFVYGWIDARVAVGVGTDGAFGNGAYSFHVHAERVSGSPAGSINFGSFYLSRYASASDLSCAACPRLF